MSNDYKHTHTLSYFLSWKFTDPRSHYLISASFPLILQWSYSAVKVDNDKLVKIKCVLFYSCAALLCVLLFEAPDIVSCKLIHFGLFLADELVPQSCYYEEEERYILLIFWINSVLSPNYQLAQRVPTVWSNNPWLSQGPFRGSVKSKLFL